MYKHVAKLSLPSFYKNCAVLLNIGTANCFHFFLSCVIQFGDGNVVLFMVFIHIQIFDFFCWGQGFIIFSLYYSLKREWADPGGTAIPGQPVAKAEQAPDTSPSSKNQFNIVDPQWGSYQILS